ncbi:DUF91 domain-containing protein [Aquibacillus halophilus]|uniref:DUF91 domain-containing protein n=1 Tax=Aquibacillus halophilus TaxID=930132 RepID=A0A6A8DCP4_9BACI|nr:endonuclease NucS domain-containing protein [Aquibacillus halophilus]MRH43324.1 DUF91 domain-containing protein [Aquibacillus halophilus]
MTRSKEGFSEKDIQDILVVHPEIIEDGLQFIKKEEVLYGRRIDLLLKDTNGKEVLVELKNTEITYEHIGQLIWYAGAMIREGQKIPRTILIGRKVHPVLHTAFNHYGIEWREYSPEYLINYLRETNSLLFPKYEHIHINKKLSTKKVGVAPPKTQIPLDYAELIYHSAQKLQEWFFSSYIPIQRFDDYHIVFNDKVEESIRNSGNWIGNQRRFSIVGTEYTYEGTIYFGTSGNNGKNNYPEGKDPVYLSVDIGSSSKSGEIFMPKNHTHSLKIPLHDFIQEHTGNININLPIKGPGLKDKKEYIYSKIDDWNIERSFIFLHEKPDIELLWNFSRSVIAIAFLKQKVKNRVKT